VRAVNVSLENFRNYEKAEVSFEDGVNIIYGKNGAGKTNLIEALYTFSYARSFRAPTREFLKHGSQLTRMELEFVREGREQSADMVFSKDNIRKIRINEIDVKKTSSLLGNFICVLFTPDELSLVKDGPERRRKFLDTSIVSLRPYYFSALSGYNSCIKQKNALLKSNNYALLDIWNEKLAEYGASIAMTRKKYIDALSERARRAQSDISGGKEDLEVIYSHSYKLGESKEETKSFILEKINEAEDREKENRLCLVGPHRDDISFKINSFNARHFASQGQQRSIVLSLKSAQMDIIKSEYEEYPVLLLDDVMSELDSQRRDFFTEKIKGKQVIITCTDLENINFTQNARLIKVDDGKVCM
jgi:DNA replication and repair protein RecF